MKTPKYIDNLLRRRTRLAVELIKVCGRLDEWLDKNGADPDGSCWLSGVEVYVNPEAAEREVRRAISEVQE